MDIVITVFCLILLVLLTVMLVKILFNGVESINKLAEKHREKNSVNNKLEKEETDEVMVHNNTVDMDTDNINIYNIEAENVKTPVKENKVKGKRTSYFHKAASSVNNIIRKVKKNIVKFINDAEYYASKADKEADNQEYINVSFMKNQALSDENDLNTGNSLYSHLKNKYNKYMPYSNIDLKMLANDKNINLADIDTSMVEDFSSIFENSIRQDFSGIETWDTRSVTNMENMFTNAVYFNADISSWKVNNVKNMNNMFAGAVNFNQNLNNWWVKSNISLKNIFKNTPLQHNPPKWYNKCIKYKAKYVDEKISFGLYVFLFLFYIYSSFLTPEKSSLYFFCFTPETKNELISLIKDKHIPLTLINTSKITDMSWLFYGGVAIDYKGIEKWDVSNVENMEGMFCGAGVFAKNLNNWNVSKVTNMQYMFADTIVLQEYLQWNINKNVLYYGMFKNLSEEYETPEWYKLKNEFNVKYYPADKEELKNMLNDKNILAGEIDVSRIKDMSYLFENVSPVKIDYYSVYRSLLRDKYLKDDEIERLAYMKETGFYDKLADIQQYIHDSYPGIEFWNVSNVDNTSYMFKNAEITIDYELWDMSSVREADGMFDNSPMEHINYYDKMYLKMNNYNEE